MSVLEELEKPIRWEHIGKEKEFENNVYENLDQIIDIMELPSIKVVERQKQIRMDNFQIKMDIAIRHIDGSATIFEVKKTNKKHPATSPFQQMQAIGQLLLYQNVFQIRTGVKPRLVLIDNKIHKRTYYSFLEDKLPITLMELQKDRLFIPYRAF